MNLISRKEAIEKGLKRFFTGKPCNHGHISERTVSSKGCLECSRIRQAARPAEYHAQSRKRYYENHRDRLREEKKADYHKVKDDPKFKARRAAYQKSEPFLASVRKYQAKIKAKKPWLIQCRAMITQCVIKAGTERRKGDRTKDRLGYTPEKFKERIEFNFKPGMSWDNHGEWHVDHVKPIARFVEQGVTDAKMINCLSNLRPMWASENINKGAKWQGLK